MVLFSYSFLCALALALIQVGCCCCCFNSIYRFTEKNDEYYVTHTHTHTTVPCIACVKTKTIDLIWFPHTHSHSFVHTIIYMVWHRKKKRSKYYAVDTGTALSTHARTTDIRLTWKQPAPQFTLSFYTSIFGSIFLCFVFNLSIHENNHE